MSCIDAAIIKALVEHIGIDPEDVPVGSPHECVKYTAGEGIAISGDNVISSTNTCKCAAVADELLDVQFGTAESDSGTVITLSKDNIDDYIKPGDMLVLESKSDSNYRYYHFCTFANHIIHIVRFVSGGTESTNYVNGSTLTTDISASSYNPVGLYRIHSTEMTIEALRNMVPWLSTKLQQSA